MAEIKAFKALRYNEEKAGEIGKLCCPPYDIINEEQRLSYIDENEFNVIRLELPKGENAYINAKNTLNEWIDKDILKHDLMEALYVYEQEFKSKASHGETKSLKGLICRVRLEEFEKGIVLPHEETLSKAKQDRFELMKATNCNFSQIYSLYNDDAHVTRERIENLTKDTKPRYEYFDGMVRHKLWLVNDELAINAICEDFAGRKIYIADGHHRYETALNYKKYCEENNLNLKNADHVMMLLCDMGDEGLVVFPTHRLLRDLENFDMGDIREKCEEYFDIFEKTGIENVNVELEKLYNDGKKAYAFYTGESTYLLMVLKDISIMEEILKGKSEAYKNLDVSVLHNLVLERVLGIDKENMAQQINLTYTRDFNEAIEFVDSKKVQCAVIMNPTRVEEIAKVAAAGEKMPQKSTYFYPKQITGMVMNDLDSL